MDVTEFRDACRQVGFEIVDEKKLHFSEMLYHLRKTQMAGRR